MSRYRDTIDQEKWRVRILDPQVKTLDEQFCKSEAEARQVFADGAVVWEARFRHYPSGPQSIRSQVAMIALVKREAGARRFKIIATKPFEAP